MVIVGVRSDGKCWGPLHQIITCTAFEGTCLLQAEQRQQQTAVSIKVHDLYGDSKSCAQVLQEIGKKSIACCDSNTILT